MTELTPINAVLFDLDGTLVETHIDFDAMRSAVATMARESSVPARVIDGLDILGTVYAASDYLSGIKAGGDAFRRAAFAMLEELEVSGCSRPIAIPGAAETLARLNTGIGIVTRNCRAVASRLIADFDLTCDVLLTRDEVPRVKPNPDHLIRALRELNVPASHSIMVGDHWMDVKAGIDAGCAATLGVLHGSTPTRFEPCRPTAVIERIGEVFDYVTQTNANK